jgi:hypothetical protein
MAAERCKRLILVCREDLMPLFATQPGIAQIRAAGTITVSEFDTYLPLLSLPRVFGTTLVTIPATVPYFDLAAIRRRKDPSSLPLLTQSGRLKVGVVWAGSPTHQHDRHRSCALGELLPLLRLPGIDFYSLQKGERRRELAELPPGVHLEDLEPSLHDFGDLALLLDQLDLVCTVDTAVAHLAGALGKAVLVLLACSGRLAVGIRRRNNSMVPDHAPVSSAAAGGLGSGDPADRRDTE